MKSIFKNIKTSVFGAVAGLPLLVEGVASKDLAKIVTGLGTLLIGIFAKDSSVD